jgi:hypothetical protein
VIFMDVGGRILEDCSKDEFFSHPENRQPRTKDFLNKILQQPSPAPTTGTCMCATARAAHRGAAHGRAVRPRHHHAQPASRR